MYNITNYIYWAKEAKRINLNVDEFKSKYFDIQAKRIKISDKTKRSSFTEETYNYDKHGDYYSLYLLEDGEYRIYSTNSRDNTKNLGIKKDYVRSDTLFDNKFKELNGVSLRVAFGFVNKCIKRCIPKQFDYVNPKFLNKEFIGSSIDASSQYASGCLGLLPDAHHFIRLEGRHQPTAEYPFAFYASGHLAIYNELDTHDWLISPYFKNLFRLNEKIDGEYIFMPVKDEDEVTILCKASDYTMNSTWEYFYNNKQKFTKDSDSYNNAKLVINQTIGCWHRKDKDKKSFYTYDDHGSYQMAHIVAVAIARGNQKILNKVETLNPFRIAHICVDGIIYAGNDVQGISETKMGVFAQEFTGCKTVIKDINVYAAELNGVPVKFRHGSYDQIYGQDIDKRTVYGIKDLDYLSKKETIGDILC